MSKYGDDIRRIARVKDEKDPNTNKDKDKKPAIDAKRGIAYFDANGKIVSEKSSPGGAIPQVGSGIQKGASDNLQKAKDQQGDQGENPVGGSNTTSQTPVNVKNLIDGLTDPSAALGALNGMTDPFYGDALVARFDGMHALPATITNGTGDPADSATFLNSFDPGTLEGWQTGKYWAIGGETEATPGLAVAAYIATTRANFPLPYPTGYGDAYWVTASLTGSGSPPYTTYSFEWYQGPGGSVITSNVIRQNCSGGESYCPLVEPTASQWPGDYISNLSLAADGLLKSNTFDFTRIGKAYRDGVSTLIFKFDSGTRTGVIEPGINNSRLIYEIDSGGIAIGTVRQYNMGKIEGSGTNMIVTRPRTLITAFSAADIQNYRIPGGSLSFIRAGGIPLK